MKNNFYRTKFLKNFNLVKTPSSSIMAGAFFKKELDEPTYLTFRLDFGYPNDEISKSLDYFPNPLLNPDTDMYTGTYDATKNKISITKDKRTEYPYSTYRYLKENIGDTERANALLSFIKEIGDIQENYPYYFTNIDGIGNLLKIKPDGGMRIGKDGIITITTLEAIDQRISGMMNTYKKIVWDDVFQRWVVPDMMRWFNLKIYISEVRLFHNFEQVPITNDMDEDKTALELVNTYLNDVMPTMMLDCMQCEFIIDDLNSYDSFSSSSSQNRPQDGPKIKIRVGNIMQYQMYPMFDAESFYNMENHEDGKEFNIRTGKLEKSGEAGDTTGIGLTEKNILSDESLSRNGKYGVYDHTTNLPTPISTNERHGLKVYDSEGKGNYSISADANNTTTPALIKEMKDVEGEIKMKALASQTLNQIKQFVDTNAMLAQGSNAGANIATNSFNQLLDKMSLLGASDPISIAMKSAANNLIKRTGIEEKIGAIGQKIEDAILPLEPWDSRKTGETFDWNPDTEDVSVNAADAMSSGEEVSVNPANAMSGKSEDIAVAKGGSLNEPSIIGKLVAGGKVETEKMRSISASQSLTSDGQKYSPTLYNWKDTGTISGLDENSMASSAKKGGSIESTSFGEIAAGSSMVDASTLSKESLATFEWNDPKTIVYGIDKDSLEKVASQNGKIDDTGVKMPSVEINPDDLFAPERISAITTEGDWTGTDVSAEPMKANFDEMNPQPKTQAASWDSSSQATIPTVPNWDASTPTANPLTASWEDRSLATEPAKPEWDASSPTADPLVVEWDETSVTTAPMAAEWNNEAVSASPSKTIWNYSDVSAAPETPSWTDMEMSASPSRGEWDNVVAKGIPSKPQWEANDVSAGVSTERVETMEKAKTEPAKPEWEMDDKKTQPNVAEWKEDDKKASPSKAEWEERKINTKESQPDWEATDTKTSSSAAKWEMDDKKTQPNAAEWKEDDKKASPSKAEWEDVSTRAMEHDASWERMDVTANPTSAKWEERSMTAQTTPQRFDGQTMSALPSKPISEGSAVSAIPSDPKWERDNRTTNAAAALWGRLDTTANPTSAKWEERSVTTQPDSPKWERDDKVATANPSKWEGVTVSADASPAKWDLESASPTPSQSGKWDMEPPMQTPRGDADWDTMETKASPSSPKWDDLSQRTTSTNTEWKNIKVDETGSGDAMFKRLNGQEYGRKIVIPKKNNNMPQI